MKKAQLEAAYKKQQQEISQLKDFVARNKARVATRNMAMSRQKKLDKMDRDRTGSGAAQSRNSISETARTPGRYIFETKDLVIGYDEPLSKPLNLYIGARTEDRPDRSQRNRKNDALEEHPRTESSR